VNENQIIPVSTALAGPTSLPAPRCPLKIRPASLDDLPFIDALQKMHTHMVGWFPHQQMAAYVNGGHVLIAETFRDEETKRQGDKVESDCSATSSLRDSVSPSLPISIGYCIAKDKYNGRDDVGIVYQLNVMPARQKHLAGAMLIQATFARAAYGCRLFSCWCAQDIQANYFWEALGFFPLAFRTGSRGKQRTHIFWQRRVRQGDVTTPFWYPCETRGGAIREDRLVFPIPPNVHWRDAKPIVLPGSPLDPRGELVPLVTAAQKREPRPRVSTAQKIAVVRSQSKHLAGLPTGKAAVITGGGIRYIDRADHVPESKLNRAPKEPAPKFDPETTRKTRELRDVYLEHLNTQQIPALGKYEVGRNGDGKILSALSSNNPALPSGAPIAA
jgi:hypothetical protein